LAELSRYELDEESVQKVQDDLDLLSSSQSNIEMLSQIKTIARSDGYEENDIYSMINLASKNSNKIKNDSNNDDISRVIEEIRNKTEELCDLADSAIGNYPEDQKQLQLLEETMSFWLDFSRKCNCEVDELPKLQEDLSDELNELKNNSYSIEEIIAKKDEVYAQYKKEAGVLTKLRTSKVDELTTSIQSVLAKFNMGNMVFHIACYDNSDSVSIGGNESIEFLIASGPGYPLNSISKVASGGELSRISLAVQASLAEIAEFGTIVFDEVDVGIGGNTAQMVGEFLAKLGNKSQVLCITHQPQVASLASTQLRVHKIVESGFINTKILQLEYNQRVNEISRMIGDSSEYAVKLAKDMLSHIK
jgi:DNA repair protein RecN (Recombination protein N)